MSNHNYPYRRPFLIFTHFDSSIITAETGNHSAYVVSGVRNPVPPNNKVVSNPTQTGLATSTSPRPRSPTKYLQTRLRKLGTGR